MKKIYLHSLIAFSSVGAPPLWAGTSSFQSDSFQTDSFQSGPSFSPGEILSLEVEDHPRSKEKVYAVCKDFIGGPEKNTKQRVISPYGSREEGEKFCASRGGLYIMTYTEEEAVHYSLKGSKDLDDPEFHELRDFTEEEKARMNLQIGRELHEGRSPENDLPQDEQFPSEYSPDEQFLDEPFQNEHPQDEYLSHSSPVGAPPAENFQASAEEKTYYAVCNDFIPHPELEHHGSQRFHSPLGSWEESEKFCDNHGGVYRMTDTYEEMRKFILHDRKYEGRKIQAYSPQRDFTEKEIARLALRLEGEIFEGEDPENDLPQDKFSQNELLPAPSPEGVKGEGEEAQSRLPIIPSPLV